jgi:hypothetical protein
MTEDQLVERVANVIERSMFAPHEMPLSDPLHAKYLETARAVVAEIKFAKPKLLYGHMPPSMDARP